MDTNTRLLIKALTWNALGIAVMTVMNYPYTGSLLSALWLAVSVSVLGFVSYLIHEKAWNAVRWGRRRPGKTVRRHRHGASRASFRPIPEIRGQGKNPKQGPEVTSRTNEKFLP